MLSTKEQNYHAIHHTLCLLKALPVNKGHCCYQSSFHWEQRCIARHLANEVFLFEGYAIITESVYMSVLAILVRNLPHFCNVNGEHFPGTINILL